jgi:hypothetical protein
MALHFKLQLVVVTDDDQQVSVDALVVLGKGYERLEQVGLTLAGEDGMRTVRECPRLLVAYDVDAEGEKGAERLG